MKGRAIIYALFFLIEAVGMGIIFWDGIPLFRHLIRFEHASTPADSTVMTIAAVLIQGTYWTVLRHDPPFDLPRHQFAGHVFLFLSRLVFIFASGVFSLVVYRYSDVFDLSFVRVSVMMIVLFSIFCFSRNLERIGNLFNAGYRIAAPEPPA